jgi:hypothetical protein
MPTDVAPSSMGPNLMITGKCSGRLPTKIVAQDILEPSLLAMTIEAVRRNLWWLFER